MLSIAFRFTSAGYHATPWGRHVNEADVAWPPEPWRIIRALIATWHRKVDPAEWPESVLAGLVEKLADELPVFHLPPAIHSHCRHYMPVREGKNDKSKLIFDGFARLSTPSRPLIVSWPEVELEANELALLDLLLLRLAYLGRAESWVEATRTESDPEIINYTPDVEGVDPETGEVREVVRLLAPRPADDYAAWRRRMLDHFSHASEGAAATPAERRRMEGTMPESLLDALRVETADLRAAGWNRPPASRLVHYLRPADCLDRRGGTPPSLRPTLPATTARFLLTGKPRPRIEDAVTVAECLKRAVLSKAKHRHGEHAIPPTISGHDLPHGNRHGHAFYLAEDADADGRIDHVIVHAPDGLSAIDQQVLADITRLWHHSGHQWDLVLENAAPASAMQSSSVLLRCSCTWISCTPYLHPWHQKKRFGIAEQVRRECRERGLPDVVAIERIAALEIRGRERTPLHFRRFRSKRGLRQPDRRGTFLSLRFESPIQGPLALGFGCHFGLGLFAATSDGA